MTMTKDVGASTDDDPLEGINNRLEEVQSMVKPKAELSGFIEDMDPEQRERIYVRTT